MPVIELAEALLPVPGTCEIGGNRGTQTEIGGHRNRGTRYLIRELEIVRKKNKVPGTFKGDRAF